MTTTPGEFYEINEFIIDKMIEGLDEVFPDSSEAQEATEYLQAAKELIGELTGVQKKA